MKFTVEQHALSKMLKLVSKRMPFTKKSDPTLRLSACAARVFVEANETVAGVEALVFEDGTCDLDRVPFTKLIQSYGDKKNLTIEANERFIRVAMSQRGVLGYSPRAVPPADFQVFPVTDTWVAASQVAHDEPAHEAETPPTASAGKPAPGLAVRPDRGRSPRI